MLSAYKTHVGVSSKPPDRWMMVWLVTALAVVSSAAVAQEIPRAVQGYALQLEAECAAGPNPGPVSPTSSPDLIRLAADGPQGKIFIVDGAYTRCGDTAPLCGTGGCPLGIFRTRDGVTTNLYDDQALGWHVSADKKTIVMPVHGSKCGGSGPDRCALRLDLRSGKRRFFVPPN
jgi:hypothetical protein